jgi:hypothetical protein
MEVRIERVLNLAYPRRDFGPVQQDFLGLGTVGVLESAPKVLERSFAVWFFGLEEGVSVSVLTYPSVLWRKMKFSSPKRDKMILSCPVLPPICVIVYAFSNF